jgi:hypothetical protein
MTLPKNDSPKKRFLPKPKKTPKNTHSGSSSATNLIFVVTGRMPKIPNSEVSTMKVEMEEVSLIQNVEGQIAEEGVVEGDREEGAGGVVAIGVIEVTDLIVLIDPIGQIVEGAVGAVEVEIEIVIKIEVRVVEIEIKIKIEIRIRIKMENHLHPIETENLHPIEIRMENLPLLPRAIKTKTEVTAIKNLPRHLTKKKKVVVVVEIKTRIRIKIKTEANRLPPPHARKIVATRTVAAAVAVIEIKTKIRIEIEIKISPHHAVVVIKIGIKAKMEGPVVGVKRAIKIGRRGTRIPLVIRIRIRIGLPGIKIGLPRIDLPAQVPAATGKVGIKIKKNLLHVVAIKKSPRQVDGIEESHRHLQVEIKIRTRMVLPAVAPAIRKTVVAVVHHEVGIGIKIGIKIRKKAAVGSDRCVLRL